ncbi:MAG: glycoside hydrolase family 140 protein [Bacteroidetes bacterium]|nr:glycoside hydrolase family 140 protein [Bacteroidota bacterium]
MFRRMIVILIVTVPLCIADVVAQPSSIAEKGRLTVSWNGRYLQFENGEPFFYLGDTGWLLCMKLTREEIEYYLENRRQKGFTVIQMIVIHSLPAVNAYGDTALCCNDFTQPIITPGNDPNDTEEYDYWDHLDYIIDCALEKNMFIGLVPVWGSIVKAGLLKESTATIYAQWLAKRYGRKPNIIWINGGDSRGDIYPNVWHAIGVTLKKYDSLHLVTFHPFGRTRSSDWFHTAPWLDFNMFQSGHRRYDQDPGGVGEDNWKYVVKDYQKYPPKPTLDGEPSYESIPQGLHDTTQPRWTDLDVRRYAYWSVLAGACGFTYGHNAVMQFHRPCDGKGAYGVQEYWYTALDAQGAMQMKYLKHLIVDNGFYERWYDPSLLVSPRASKYEYVLVSRGKNFILAYTFTGKSFTINLRKLKWKRASSLWYDPRIGVTMFNESIKELKTQTFLPPGKGDWVLIIKEETL